jgi:hypothetical protein
VCRNWKLWIGLGAAALVLALAAPNLRPALPYLLVAACPLSMLAITAGMAFAARFKQPRLPGSDQTTNNDDELSRLRAEVAGLREHAHR